MIVRLLVLCACVPFETGLISAAESDQPNVIYIMADDLGYGDLGCYGQQVIETPNIDQLAAEGIRFTDHYAGHTVCRPSRLVLWSGQHVGHTGLIGNAPRSLTGSEATVSRLLKEAGYTTGGVGKWALGHVNEPSEIDNAGPHDQPFTTNHSTDSLLRLRLFGEFLEKGVIRRGRPWLVIDVSGQVPAENRLVSLWQQLCGSPVPLT